MSRLLRVVVPLLVLASCGGPSADEIRAQFDVYVSGANSCLEASECVVVFTSCPLGCFVAVRTDRKGDVEAKARDLIRDYERGGMSCQYACIMPGPAVCQRGRCTVQMQ